MQVARSIIATNAVITLADGHREVIADAAIEDGARQINEKGGLPQLIEHDWLRPCGWAERAWTERDGNLIRLVVESTIPESKQDWEVIEQKYTDFMSAWSAERLAPFEDLARSFKHPDVRLTFDTDCVYLHAPGLAKLLCSSVFAKADQDGLIPLQEMKVGKNGWLHSNGFLLVPSPLLRPGFGLPNAPNHLFLSSFLGLAEKTSGYELSLSLDADLLGIPDSLKPMEQRDFWWGPPYRGIPSRQPYGVTVHGPTKYDRLNGLVRTEFWWYGKTERTFEMEELVDRRDLRSTGQSTRGMRFVHSIFQGKGDTARHLDGAIRSYPERLWQERTDPKSNISNFGKRAARMKVWRADGSLCPEIWYELIHMFFRGNFTVGEYFGLPDPRAYRSLLKSSNSTSKGNPSNP